MSLHQHKSFQVAVGKNAAAATTWRRWDFLTSLTKRELAELVTHLAALSTDSYDTSIADDDLLIPRVEAELASLRATGLV